jgi:uncharacterized membrane protein HdeD (DUF308 family)
MQLSNELDDETMAVSHRTRVWSWATLAALVLVAWGSFFAHAIGHDVLPRVLVVGVVVVFVGIFNTYRAVRDDDTLDSEETSKLLSWIRLFGPLGVAQIVLYTYFPNSKFGGH